MILCSPTARARPRRRPLIRVIVDSHLRLPLESRVVKTAQDDVLVLCSFAEEKERSNCWTTASAWSRFLGHGRRPPRAWPESRAVWEKWRSPA